MKYPDLPTGIEVRVEVILEREGHTLSRGIVDILREGGTASFTDVGIAVQAGSYEALRTIWPKTPDEFD